MMKRLLFAIFTLLLLAGLVAPAVIAGMDDRDYSIQVIGAGTNTKTYVLRGTLKEVWVDLPANATGTVTVTHSPSGQSGSNTLLTLSSATADSVDRPAYSLQDSVGAAIANTTNVPYVPASLAGPVTVEVIGANGASVTNTYGITLLYLR